MPMTDHSPEWHLRFGIGVPVYTDCKGFDAECTAALFSKLVAHSWKWDGLRLALQDRTGRLGPPRCFEVLQCVQPGASNPLVLEGMALTLHPVLGMPVIHGDAIKGACRAAVLELMKGSAGLDSALARLFGGPEGNGESVFEEAWWVPPDKTQVSGPFAREVEGREEVDRLLGNTRPISRLAAVGRFAFWLTPESERQQQWHDDEAWAALEATLRHFGVGSRRNVDAYGRFSTTEAA